MAAHADRTPENLDETRTPSPLIPPAPSVAAGAGIAAAAAAAAIAPKLLFSATNSDT